MSLDMELEDRLINWSYWVIDILNNRVGYPKSSTIANFGLTDSHVRRSKPPFSLNNLKADEMNGWVNVMGKEHPELKKVISAYYLREKGMRVSDLAKAQSVSEGMFKHHLRLARTWLKGRLSVEFEKRTCES